MSRRRYRQQRRAETSQATRRRIVEATLELHDEQGISGTSVRDVAGRARVAPSTVLNHFPRMTQLIEACGEVVDQLAPMPTVAALAGAASDFQRVVRMAETLFEWWERLGPGFDHLRIDRRRIPAIDEWFREIEAMHLDLARAALGRNRIRVALLAAITTVDAWRSLRDAGMTPRQAAQHVARLIATATYPKEVIH